MNFCFSIVGHVARCCPAGSLHDQELRWDHVLENRWAPRWTRHHYAATMAIQQTER